MLLKNYKNWEERLKCIKTERLLTQIIGGKEQCCTVNRILCTMYKKKNSKKNVQKAG